MFVPKWVVALTALLVAGFGLLNSQEPKQKAEAKKFSRLDELRSKKLKLAQENLTAQFDLYRAGVQDLILVREAAIFLARAKLDVTTAPAEREAILKEQRQLFESITELVAKRVERGSAARLDLTLARIGLVEAEIELEEFKEAQKKDEVPRK